MITSVIPSGGFVLALSQPISISIRSDASWPTLWKTWIPANARRFATTISSLATRSPSGFTRRLACGVTLPA